MPSGWLKIPHFRQEHEYSCVAACARMVLAYHGAARTEDELRSLLDTRPTGTPARNVMRLSDPDFEVHLRPSNLPELQQVLSRCPLFPVPCHAGNSCFGGGWGFRVFEDRFARAGLPLLAPLTSAEAPVCPAKARQASTTQALRLMPDRAACVAISR